MSLTPSVNCFASALLAQSNLRIGFDLMEISLQHRFRQELSVKEKDWLVGQEGRELGAYLLFRNFAVLQGHCEFPSSKNVDG